MRRCLNNREVWRLGKLVRILLVLNVCLWVYFWISFAQASYVFRPDPLGHPAGTGYTFWGHAVGVVESGLVYPFFRIVFYVEFPSFIVAVLIERVFDPQLTSHRFLAGISVGGWSLVETMLLSFIQWYLIGCIAQKLWYRFFSVPTRDPT